MRIKLITIPNLLTLSNLFCGVMATVEVLQWSDFTAAFWWIVAAAVCDFFDGFAARLLNQSSPIGAELDSLADVVSFGLAPSLVLYSLYADVSGCFALDSEIYNSGAYIMFSVALFSALRLARFNVDTTQHSEFMGLPVPACGLFIASIGLLASSLEPLLSKEVLLVVAVVMSWLLVSPVRMFALKFKGFGWTGNELRYTFMVGCVVLLAVLRLEAIPVIVILYVVVSTVRWVVQSRRAKSITE